MRAEYTYYLRYNMEYGYARVAYLLAYSAGACSLCYFVKDHRLLFPRILYAILLVKKVYGYP